MHLASLDAMVKQCKVVVSTVGPFAKYGSELVAACVRHGRDYCDITGEVHWVRSMIDQHHQAAKTSGARIVHCCGFDSIPSDLGTLLLQQEGIKRYGSPFNQVNFYVIKARGGFSGGTAASMLNLFEQLERTPSLRRSLANPYVLNPKGERHGLDTRDQMGVRYDSDVPGFTAPFVMAAVNTRVVRRSNALLNYRYGHDFRYRETMCFKPSAKGLASAAAITTALVAFMAAAALPITRKQLQQRLLPAPGEGPTQQQRDKGMFEVLLIGKGTGDDGAPTQLRAKVAGNKDPGYGETCKMLAESALCLAHDRELPTDGGILTPASCMGLVLVERLRRAGITFSV
ncbi:MAG TPA: saccharopine dehydrogenase [Sorangium sp.]|nr:saccharopine dehydrogenase [Sorangium sp.]